MKKALSILIATLMLFAAFGCDKKDEQDAEKLTAANEIVLSAFDDYYDIQKIRWSGMRGEVRLVDDAEYVVEGSKSARLYIDYTADVPCDYNDNDGGKSLSGSVRPQMTFTTNIFNSTVGNIANIDSFNISVYNANDRAVDLVFAVTDDGKKVAFTDGRTLEPGRWNHISFDLKSYFFPSGLGVSEYILYLFDEERDTVDDVALYFDNCYVKTTTNKKAPAKTYKDGEILDFIDMRDLSYVITTAQSGYPAFFVTYTDREVFEGRKGCIKATVHSGSQWQYDVNVNNNGYKINILSNVVKERMSDATSVSVDCANTGTGNLYVSIVVTSVTKKTVVKELLRAGETKTVEMTDLGALEGEKPEGLTVMIDNWNLVGAYDVYLGNLQIK